MRINLKELYPFYTTDIWVEVDEEIVEEMHRFDNLDSAYRLRAYRHRAYYSLDASDGMEHQVLFPIRSSEMEFEETWLRQEIYKAMSQLSEKSFRRIYAHYFLGLSKVAIAQIEKVDERAVRKSISSGLKKLSRLLDKILD